MLEPRGGRLLRGPGDDAAVVAAAGVAVVLVVLVALLLGSRGRSRPVARRMAAVATRLENPGPSGQGQADDGDTVSRLERLAEGAVLRVSDAEAVVSRLAGALDGVASGVVICDEGGEVVHRNSAATAMARTNQGEDLVTEAVDDVLRSAVRGNPATRVLEMLGPPRRTLVVEGLPIDDGRRSVGGAAVIDDISERRRLDVVRRDFVTNLTAELKTPVAALGLLAGTIVSEDEPALTRRLAQRLSRDALLVGRVIDDLVELSRIDAQLLPVRDPVPVHLLVAQAVEEVRSLALHRSIRMDATEAPLGLTVVGDRRQLVSGLRHLIENAVRFSEDGSTVKLKVSVGDMVEVAVRDQGAGIPARELGRIFECFYRVEATRRRDTAGIGLGLAIASQVAAAHGGDVTVESEEGTGSTFTLRLPIGPGAMSAPVSKAG